MNDSLTLRLASPLEKIFPAQALTMQPYSAFSMLRNERAAFQAAYHLKGGEPVAARFSIESPLVSAIRAYAVGLVPARAAAPENADDYYLTKEPGDFPDVLYPVQDGALTLRPGAGAIWVELYGGDALPAGEYPITVRLCIGGEPAAEQTLRVTVIDALLPEQTLIYTNWFHTDCLAAHYGVAVFSDEYWRITENFLRRARQFGMNMVLTPVFTPPLDTQVGGERPTVQLVDVAVESGAYRFGFQKFDRWVAMCRRCGIAWFEISHFFTQWGAEHAPKVIARTKDGEKRVFGWETDAFGDEYREFLRQFAAALVPHLDELGIRDNCVLHVSDEPGEAQIPAYRKASAILHECFPGFRVIDALSDFSFYQQKLVDIPIPSSTCIEPFIGKVPELWTYYCCSQGYGNVSNRFFAMPSQRTRVLGYQLYKFDAVGFLQWAFNFWFSQFSIRQIDPFTETDAGGGFPAGDSFVVYPGADGAPLDSLRLHVFYAGLQDMMALQLLESKVGKKEALAVLEEGLTQPLTFSCYPQSAAWHLETRERINRAICGGT